jgi:beta-N-acetylhexosaminidase
MAWVENTRDAMSVEAQIAQLFVLSARHDSIAETDGLLGHAPGGIHRFPTHDLDAAWAATRHAVERSEVPLILSGDIEGGTVSAPFTTAIPNQMGIAACDDLDLSADLARIVGQESRALGYNWSFTPVVDINRAFRNAVVGTRSYGSDPDRILAQARAYVSALQAQGVAACAKHWPGDGLDDRDQHLVTSVNDMAMDEWRATFGRIFGTLVDDGVMTIMSAHIALPAYIREKMSNAGARAFEPASVSRLLNEDLLRGELGFDGLIVSDATVMGGLTSWMARAEAVPAVIEGGCDVFLFSRDPAADMGFMLQGLRDGRLSEQRLHDAVTRFLMLKAKLGLHRMTPDERIAPVEETRALLRQPAHLDQAARAAAASITLVKDREALIPIAPDQHKRVLIISDEGASFFSGAPERDFTPLIAGLQNRGFAVRNFDPEAMPTPEDTDLNREIPTLLISFGQPYYLYDAPNFATYINAYASLPDVQTALVERLTGDAPFTGNSPVDAFCGKEQLSW